MSLGDRRKNRASFSPPKLMLTSMMDMFTIILIFLLCSFSDRPETLDGVKDLDLPHSTAELNYSESIQIILTQETLRLNDDTVASVKEETIEGMDPDNLKESSLYKELRTLYEANQAEGLSEADDEGDASGEESLPHVLFICDRHHSFKTINSVMKTAGLAGFPNFQFAVLEGTEE